MVAPSRSAGVVPEDVRTAATDRLTTLGFEVTFAAHVFDDGPLDSAAIADRVDDLHAAFGDPDIDIILTAIGGHLSNALLPYIEWRHIRSNPKIFSGFSDITALQNAALAKAGLVTFSGPHWSTFGCRHHIDSTVKSFLAAITSRQGTHELSPSTWWSDDLWYLNQDDRVIEDSTGWWTISPGNATGMMIGGNLNTLGLLRGTEFLPPLACTVPFIEDDASRTAADFARELAALVQQTDSAGGGIPAGLVIGRLPRSTGMTQKLLTEIIHGLPPLRKIPVIANVDFGHTHPMVTFPVGGHASVISDGDSSRISWTCLGGAGA